MPDSGLAGGAVHHLLTDSPAQLPSAESSMSPPSACHEQDWPFAVVVAISVSCGADELSLHCTQWSLGHSETSSACSNLPGT